MEAALQTIQNLLATAGESAREEALRLLRAFTYSLEKPIDTLDRIASVQLLAAVTESAIDMGLFKLLASSSVPLRSKDISLQLGTAELLTARILRYLSAQGLVTETGEHEFGANDRTRAFAQPAWRGAVLHHLKTLAPSTQAIPDFLKQNNYQDINDNTKTAWQSGHGTDLPAFPWLASHPDNFTWLMQFMTIQRTGLADWLSVFPVESKIGDWISAADEPLFVDVGGGYGHQAISFRQRYSHLQGAVVVQDLPPIIEQAQLPADIAKVPVDLFTASPIKDAKFYYLRNVLHDFPDHLALKILESVKSSMGRNSMILIDESSLPEKDVPLRVAQLDLLLGFALASVERTSEHWKRLLDQAGLTIESTYKYTTALCDTVIVAIPKA